MKTARYLLLYTMARVVAKDHKKNPVKHGDFDEREFWKEAFWQVDASR